MKQACVLSPATHSIRRFILEQQHADILCLSAGFADDVDEFDCRLIRSSTESVTVIEGIPAAQTATIVVVGDCCGDCTGMIDSSYDIALGYTADNL